MRMDFLAVIIMIWLMGCTSSSQNKVSSHLIRHEVKSQTIHKTLYFTANIKPLHVYGLASPVDGVVDEIYHQYGDALKKGALILRLSSLQLQNQYNEILTEYLEAKDRYRLARGKFKGTKNLWLSGLISKNAYLVEQSNLNSQRISFLQNSARLTDLKQKMGHDYDEDLSQMDFSHFKAVRAQLKKPHDLLYLKAPSDGVLLYPAKAAGEGHMGYLKVGAPIKSGEVIAEVGDLHGIVVEIDIPEIDLDQIKVGMPARIRSLAFKSQVFEGQVKAISTQAINHADTGLPSFIALVVVSALTPEEQALLRIGMSATIELDVASEHKLLVPMIALKQNRSQNLLQVIDPNGQIKDIPVVTGMIFEDQVVIDSGLKAGDTVVYSYASS